MTALDAVSVRSVSIAGDEALTASLRAAIAAHPDMRVRAVACRFIDLVTQPEFPGEVVVLAEPAGAGLFAHAVTAAAAGAVVLVHANLEPARVAELEALGVLVVPLSEPASMVADQAMLVRSPRRRASRALVAELSPRRPRLSAGERRALAYYVQGRTTVQVAAAMGVGYETAKTFLRRTRAKYAALDRPASTRAQLMVRAEEDGIS